jgi:hypothetical protein
MPHRGVSTVEGRVCAKPCDRPIELSRRCAANPRVGLAAIPMALLVWTKTFGRLDPVPGNSQGALAWRSARGLAPLPREVGLAGWLDACHVGIRKRGIRREQARHCECWTFMSVEVRSVEQ